MTDLTDLAHALEEKQMNGHYSNVIPFRPRAEPRVSTLDIYDHLMLQGAEQRRDFDRAVRSSVATMILAAAAFWTFVIGAWVTR